MKNILVVDDDEGILESIKLILDIEGYNAITATGSKEIFKKLTNTKPCVILLDVLLSGEDGREICKILKERDETKDIPIIMMSANASARDTIKVCGADEFIAKPFDLEFLLNKVSLFAH